MRILIAMVVVFLSIQNGYASDPRDPVPVSMKALPNGLRVEQVDCEYFNKTRLKSNKISIVENGIYHHNDSKRINYDLINLRDDSKSRLSNDAYSTGLILNNDGIRSCCVIPRLCDESDIHNSFVRTGVASTDNNHEFYNIGFKITDDCDEIHGSLNGPSYLVLTVDKKTLKLDQDRCYYEIPTEDGRLPFDDSARLRYLPGYKHVQIK